jgi:hypothetical protein
VVSETGTDDRSQIFRRYRAVNLKPKGHSDAHPASYADTDFYARADAYP